jgi:hypothetical protein
VNKNLAKLAIFWEDNAILTQTDLYPQLSNEHAKAMFVEIVAGRLGSLGMTIASEKNKNHIPPGPPRRLWGVCVVAQSLETSVGQLWQGQ